MRFLFPFLVLAGGAGYGVYRFGGNPLKSDVFSWLSDIPKKEWLEHGFPIVGGYILVFFAVSYLNFVFTANGLLSVFAVPFLANALCTMAEHLSDGVKDWSSVKLGGTLAGIYYAAPAAAFLFCLAVFN